MAETQNPDPQKLLDDIENIKAAAIAVVEAIDTRANLQGGKWVFDAQSTQQMVMSAVMGSVMKKISDFAEAYKKPPIITLAGG